MRRIIFVLMCMFTNFVVAQTSMYQQQQAKEVQVAVPSEEIGRYIAEHLVYPDSAAAHNIQGRVFVRFTVTADGTVDKVRVVKAVHPLLDSAAVDVVSHMPRITPAIKKGRAVPVMYTQPVTFKLDDDDDSIKVQKKQ